MTCIRQMTNKELIAECQARSWIAGENVGEPSFDFYHTRFVAARAELYLRHSAECARKHDKEQRELYGDHAVDCALQASAEKEAA